MSQDAVGADGLDIDAPIQPAGSSTAANEPSADQIAMIADMGFTQNQARKALRESVSSGFSLRGDACRR